MNRIEILPPAAKYLNKIKDKSLKRLYMNTIDLLIDNPVLGKRKTGNLKDIYSVDIYYKGINYELAYTIRSDSEGHLVIVILAGTRENFYDQLHNYWKRKARSL